MAGLEQFAGVAAATDAQKAALGKFIAQQGSAGVDSWKAEQAVGQQMGADARAGVIGSNPGIGQPNMASAVGPGQLTQMLAARAAQPGQLMAQQGAQAAADFGAYTGLIGQANSNYGDAVKGAAPIVESQTRSKVAAIQAELAAKRLQMQQEADDAAQARADRQRERDWATQDRMLMLADQARQRQWDIDDRNALTKEKEGNTLGSYDDAVKAVGVNDKVADKIAASEAYNTAVSNVYKNLIPGMSQTQVEGLINAQVDALTNTSGPEANSRMKAIIANQFANITGEHASPAYNKPDPKPDPDKDKPSGGGGGGFNFGDFAKTMVTSINPVFAGINAAQGKNPLVNALTGGGGGNSAARPTVAPTTNRRVGGQRPTPRGATLKPEDVQDWDTNEIYDAMRSLSEDNPNYEVLANEIARRNGGG